MNNLKSRLKKIEPKKFEPVQVSWNVRLPDGTQERRCGTFADMDKYIFSNDLTTGTRCEDEPEQSFTQPLKTT